MPGWNRDQQVANLAESDAFQVLADRVEVPAGDKMGRGFEDGTFDGAAWTNEICLLCQSDQLSQLR